MNKKLIAIIVAVVVAIVAIVGVVIAVSNKDDNNEPDQNKVEITDTNIDNNTQKPDNNTDKKPNGGGISIGSSDNAQDNENNDNSNNNDQGNAGGNQDNNGQAGNGGNSNNGETEKPVARCKHCNKILVPEGDKKVNDYDNHCDGRCTEWLG